MSQNSESIYSIRIAEKRDINNILHICRESFPDSIKWKLPDKIAYRWWENLFKLNSVNAYVIKNNNDICGFYIAVLDITSFKTEKEKIKIKLKEYGRVRLFKPKLIIGKLFIYIRNHFERYNYNSDSQNNHNIENDKVSWMELVAVSEKYRRRGLTKLIFQHFEEISIQRGKKKIGSTIQVNNIASIMMHQKYGFKKQAHSKAGGIYYKTLS